MTLAARAPTTQARHGQPVCASHSPKNRSAASLTQNGFDPPALTGTRARLADSFRRDQ